MSSFEFRYTIHKVRDRADFQTAIDKGDWFVEIAQAPWGGYYRPKSIAMVCYNDEGMFVCLRSYEKSIRALWKEHNDPICEDSALEFYFAPTPNQSKYYINIEVNPIGTMYTGISSLRADHRKLEPMGKEYFHMESINDPSEHNGEFWQIVYFVPCEYVRTRFPAFELKSGAVMRGNFYKCGDKTEYLHYLSWTNISIPYPEFMDPSFFGTFEFE